ncbi:MAG: hypothetical protein LC650_02105, partial [Actinobacteria bacterium]|nr:hypothetical protein [Actinomycetota bacterium]
VYMGSNYATVETPLYHAGQLYRIQADGYPLHDFIVLCTEPVYTAMDWTMYDYVNKQIQRTDTLHIPNEFLTVLTAADLDAIIDIYDPDFVPFLGMMQFEESGGAGDRPSVIIPESELHIILRDAGVPFVKWNELEYDVETMRYLIVRPAMDVFYKFFPIIREETIPVLAQGRFEKDFPDDPNFIQVRAIFGTNASQAAKGSGMGNPFQYYRDQMIGGLFMGGHAFGRPQGRPGRAGRVGGMAFNHNDLIGNLFHQATYNSMLNRYSRVKYTIREDKVEGYHTGGRYVTIEWGFMSQDWEDIPHNRKLEVRELATAYALRTFAMLRMQEPENSPGKINYSSWIERADAIEDRITTHWHEFTKPIVVRNR